MTSINSMKTALRIVALVVALGALGSWLALGANTGWTKNRIEKKTIDEVTGIEAITYEDKFIPGIEILGGAILGAGALAGVSFVVGRKQKTAI